MSGSIEVERDSRRISDIGLVAGLQLGHRLDHGVAGDIDSLDDVVWSNKGDCMLGRDGPGGARRFVNAEQLGLDIFRGDVVARLDLGETL